MWWKLLIEFEHVWINLMLRGKRKSVTRNEQKTQLYGITPSIRMCHALVLKALYLILIIVVKFNFSIFYEISRIMCPIVKCFLAFVSLQACCA